MKRALLLALVAPALAGVAPPPAPEGVAVVVAITDIRSTQGLLRVCLAGESEAFPDCPPGAAAYRASVPAGALEVRFPHVAPGRYAIALLHDENANGKVDRVLGLMPKEGFGFSRDAPVRMGPPPFTAAAFTVGSEPLRVSIRMRYIL